MEKRHIKILIRTEWEAKAQFPPNLGYQQDLRLLVVFWGRWDIRGELSTNATWQLLTIPSASPGTVNIVVIIYF